MFRKMAAGFLLLFVLSTAGVTNASEQNFPRGSARLETDLFDRFGHWESAALLLREGNSNYLFFCGSRKSGGDVFDTVRVKKFSGNLSTVGLLDTSNSVVLDFSKVPFSDSPARCGNNHPCVCDPAVIKWPNPTFYNGTFYDWGVYFTISRHYASGTEPFRPNNIGVSFTNDLDKPSDYVVFHNPIREHTESVIPPQYRAHGDHRSYGIGENDIILSQEGYYLYAWQDSSFYHPITNPGQDYIRFSLPHAGGLFPTVNSGVQDSLEEDHGIGWGALFGGPGLAWRKEGSRYRLYMTTGWGFEFIVLRADRTVSADWSDVADMDWTVLASFDVGLTGNDWNTEGNFSKFNDGELYIENGRAFVVFASGADRCAQCGWGWGLKLGSFIP